MPHLYHNGYIAFVGSEDYRVACAIAANADRPLQVCPEIEHTNEVRNTIGRACVLLVLNGEPSPEVRRHIEYALSIGTPIVALAPCVDSSVKALIEWGVTGYYASRREGLWVEVNLAASLNRADVRRVSNTRITRVVKAQTPVPPLSLVA